MQKVIMSSGGFIAAPSANRSGRPSCTNAAHCAEDLDGRIDMIIDGGEAGIGLESTIVDLTGERPVILRHGYIDKAMIERVTGPVDVETTATEKPRAPGMKYRHYAPKGELTLISGKAEETARKIQELAGKNAHDGGKTAVIFAHENASLYEGMRGISLYDAGSLNDEDTIAHSLFSVLRELDEEECRYIYSECFDTPRLGRAIMDRLTRAAEGRVIRL
jgi:L-threonylcarbamoyladenylate synthase